MQRNIRNIQMTMMIKTSLYKYNLNYQENIRNHQPVLSLPREELERVIDLSVELLKSGIQKNE